MACPCAGVPDHSVGSATPALEFDIIIIGAGSGNTLIGPELAGQSIALIDDGEWFGGTCLNAGCIPTKMFVAPATIISEAADAAQLGVDVAPQSIAVDWPRMRDRVFGRTDKLSRAGQRNRELKQPNVTVFRETVGFEDPHTLVSASGQRLHAARIVIAAGSRPAPLLAAYEPGSGIHDSDSIMRMDDLPDSLLVIGGGAVAAEFSHVFSAFGVAVTQVVRGERLLADLDDTVADRFTSVARDSWTVLTGASVDEIDRVDDLLVATLDTGEQVAVASVLVATGRIPNTDTLNAAAVGFDLHGDGRLVVDSYQRVLAGGSPVPGIFALGDVSSPWQLKHVANQEARTVLANLVAGDDLESAGDHARPGPVPAAIFSRVEVAHFGLTRAEAPADAIVVTREFGSTAWGWAHEDTLGACTIVVDRSTGSLLGAWIVGTLASVLLQPLVMAASSGRSIVGLARSMYWPHPAATEVVENALLDAEKELDK